MKNEYEETNLFRVVGKATFKNSQVNPFDTHIAASSAGLAQDGMRGSFGREIDTVEFTLVQQVGTIQVPCP